MTFDFAQLALSSPLIAVVVGALIVLLCEAFASGKVETPEIAGAPRSYLGILSLCTLAVAAYLSWGQWDVAATPQGIYHGMIAVDRFGIAANLIVFAGAALAILLADGFLREHRFDFGEFYVLVLLGTAGMVMLNQATDLVALFIGVETMSLAVYVLAGSWRRHARSSEAAMKYFLVGAFASAILIYGIALVYGTSGSTNLLALAKAPDKVVFDPVFLIGSFLILGALAFKIAAVPFHMWTPDAYEGAPTPVTAFMSAAVKAAGFVILVRVLATAMGRPGLTFGAGGWASICAVLAILTMSVGNLIALRQDNVKRMLAYSSIAHAGYVLVGVVAMARSPEEARGAILYYLLAYTLTTVGSFGIVGWYSAHGDERNSPSSIDEWAGLGVRHPAMALAMTVLLLSLGGIPPTAGFLGKLYLFKAALGQNGLMPLVLVAIANSLVSVYYYLRVVMAMYFREPGRAAPVLASRSTGLAIAIATVGVIILGLAPGWVMDGALQASLFTR